MIRFIVTKEIEVDDSVFEFEDVGVFDHEEEAKELASTIYNEMPEYEKQYYAVIVWKASGENIDTDDWNTFEECESVDIYPAKAIEGIEESLEDSDNAEITDTAQIVVDAVGMQFFMIPLCTAEIKCFSIGCPCRECFHVGIIVYQ